MVAKTRACMDLIARIVGDQSADFVRRNRVDAEPREIGGLAGARQADRDDQPHLDDVAIGGEQPRGDLAARGNRVHRLELGEALQHRQIGAQRIAFGAGRQHGARGAFDRLHRLAQKHRRTSSAAISPLL